MLIELQNDPTTDTYLKEHGLELRNGVLTGKLINFDIGKRFPDSSSLEQAYHNVLKAYNYSTSITNELTAYINDLDMTSIDQLVTDGFNINIYGVLTVGNITYGEYHRIKYFKDVTYRGTDNGLLMKKLIEHWPTVDILTECSDPAKIVCRTNTPRFDYIKGTKRFHHVVPVPFFDKEFELDHAYVLVDCADNVYDDDCKYIVSICDNHYIHTDIEPTPDNLFDILKEDRKWSTKVKKFLKSY